MNASQSRLCTFLHVDDSAEERYFVREVARLIGIPFQIEQIDSGDAAVAYISRERRFADEMLHPFPAFVLLDFDLGVSTGDYVAARIRKLPRCAELPIIIYTNSSKRDDMIRCYGRAWTIF